MIRILYLLMFLISLKSIAQSGTVLTFEQAVAIALNNNFDIQLAKNNATIADVQNTYGNAGFWPRLDLNAGGSYANNRSHQEFSTGASVNRNGLTSNNLNAGLFLSWTLFDGMRMFANKERLEILEQQGALALKLQIENTLEQLTLFYYQIVKQEQLIKGIFASIEVSEQRIKVAELKKQIGSGSNVELLQAKMDLNEQKSNLIIQRSILKEYQNNLMLLMKSEPQGTFSVDTFFAFEPIGSMDNIKQKIEQENRSVLFAQNEKRITQQVIREIRAQQYPRLGITTNYLFGRTENAAGLILLNQNLGFNFGLNISWNLFNGFVTRNQLKVEAIRLENNQIVVDRNKMTFFAQANAAYTRWMGDKETMEIEEENIKLAEQSLFINMERLRLGLGNFLEVKQSQSSYESAITRLVNARYNLKQSETILKRLTGELIR